jgi:uncharacterized membrane protein HdeD (DUF308 family)
MEYVALSGVVALFAGAIFLMVTRDPLIASVVVGGVFVIVIIGLAMMVLAMSPNKKPEGEWDKPDTGND